MALKMKKKIKLNQNIYFVTGTDTEVGKTVCTKGLLQAANQQHKKTLAYKPISAGCTETPQGLRNEDALTLQAHSSIKTEYSVINPIAYQQPIAPHIAATELKETIDLKLIDTGLETLKQYHADLILVEGAGGWHLPIDNQRLFSEWVVKHNLPVIVIVGLKLGCLNHALLTIESIQNSGGMVAGWVANHLQPNMPYVGENIATLTQHISAPLLAEVPYLDKIEEQNLSCFFNINY